MLIYIYLFSMILGGVLLGASILLGGKDVDSDGNLEAHVGGDAHAGSLDTELDAPGDASLDSSVDSDADSGNGVHGDHQHELDMGSHVGYGDFLIWSIRSIRFWTFFLAFFGATGLALDGLDLTAAWLALTAALGMGGATGFGAAAVIRSLSSDTSGDTATAKDYIGKSVRVMVPFDDEGVGKIRVRIKGQDVDLLATADDEFTKEDEAIIIEMEGSTARIARIDS